MNASTRTSSQPVPSNLELGLCKEQKLHLCRHMVCELSSLADDLMLNLHHFELAILSYSTAIEILYLRTHINQVDNQIFAQPENKEFERISSKLTSCVAKHNNLMKTMQYTMREHNNFKATLEKQHWKQHKEQIDKFRPQVLRSDILLSTSCANNWLPSALMSSILYNRGLAYSRLGSNDVSLELYQLSYESTSLILDKQQTSVIRLEILRRIEEILAPEAKLSCDPDTIKHVDLIREAMLQTELGLLSFCPSCAGSA